MNSDSRHPRPRWDATETHCHEFHQHPWQHAAHVDRHGTGRWPGAGWRTVRPRTDSPDRPGPALADPRRHGAGRARALLRGVLATWSSCRRLQTGILVRREIGRASLSGKSVYVHVEIGGRRIIPHNMNHNIATAHRLNCITSLYYI